MPKRNEFSFKKCLQTSLLHEEAKSQIETLKTVKYPRRSMQYAIQKFAATRSHINRPRSRLKRITTDREDRKLLLESLKEKNFFKFRYRVIIRN